MDSAPTNPNLRTATAPSSADSTSPSRRDVELPQVKDLNADTITENVKKFNSQCTDARMRYVFDRLVQHLHDFARGTRLSSDEWMMGLRFLTEVGQTCTDVRQEFILLSDILGLSLLVDSIDHPKAANSTEGTVLGPFHTQDAAQLSHGDELSHDENGEPCLVIGTVKDTAGKPVGNVQVDVWETDSHGFYDVQRPDRKEPDGRGVLYSNDQGDFWFKSIVPVEYPIPHDGPVGKLLKRLGRHWYRPAHMHFMFEKEGFDHLITALYKRGDPYENSDAVFGVKKSLMVDLGTVSEEHVKQYGVTPGTRLLQWDFVLLTDQESQDLRHKLAVEAMEKLGFDGVRIENGLPIPEVD